MELIRKGYQAYVKYPITDWETLRSLIALKVSDVYIDGSLGFSMKKVHDLCDGQTIIRVSPNVSPNASILGLKTNSFFIRPEDLHLYEKYIGVIDFRIDNRWSIEVQNKEDVLFDIYKRGAFLLNLTDLLEDCTFSVPNSFIKPEFGQARVNCGQHCMEPGHPCHLCGTQIELTNLVYNYFKEKEFGSQGAVKGSS